MYVNVNVEVGEVVRTASVTVAAAVAKVGEAMHVIVVSSKVVKFVAAAVIADVIVAAESVASLSKPALLRQVVSSRLQAPSRTGAQMQSQALPFMQALHLTQVLQ